MVWIRRARQGGERISARVAEVTWYIRKRTGSPRVTENGEGILSTAVGRMLVVTENESLTLSLSVSVAVTVTVVVPEPPQRLLEAQ